MCLLKFEFFHYVLFGTVAEEGVLDLLVYLPGEPNVPEDKLRVGRMVECVQVAHCPLLLSCMLAR